MNINNFIKWEPVSGIDKSLTCESLHDDYEGFRIILKGRGKGSDLLRITFESPLAYMNINESNRLKTVNETVNISEFSLFIVENSSWVKWFNKESFDLHEMNKVIHYGMYTLEDCIDVLSDTEPFVDWL